MKVSDIMSRRVVTVSPDDRLQVVREIFEHCSFSHLPVVENGRLVGMLSDRDLFSALSPHLGRASETSRDAASLNKRVHQIMSRRPLSVHHDEALEEAVEVLLGSRISCLPVMDENGRLAGILSWRDLLKAARFDGVPERQAEPPPVGRRTAS